MEAHGSWNFPPLVLILNCLCTFALNLSVFLVITHTSALTIRVAGVVKDWVVVLLSALLFADTKLTIINLFGYGIGQYLIILTFFFFYFAREPRYFLIAHDWFELHILNMKSCSSIR